MTKSEQRITLFKEAREKKAEYPDMQDYFATEAVRLKLIPNYGKAAEYF